MFFLAVAQNAQNDHRMIIGRHLVEALSDHSVLTERHVGDHDMQFFARTEWQQRDLQGNNYLSRIK